MGLFGRYLRLKRAIKVAFRMDRVVVDGKNFQWAVGKAAAMLRDGSVVAVPTDTIYGLITLIGYSDKLYELKGRSAEKPLGVFVHRPEDIGKFAEVTVPFRLLNTLYPGPVTLLFKRLPTVPEDFNPGVETIGFRIPQNKLVRDICSNFSGQLIAQTSANISGSTVNPVSVNDFNVIWDKIDYIVDCGKVPVVDDSHLGSTVVDLSQPGYYEIVREGCSASHLENVLKRAGLRRTNGGAEASTESEMIEQRK